VDASFMSILVGPPSDLEIEVVKSTLQFCEKIKLHLGEDFVNTTQCFQYGPCPFLTNGMCTRI